MKASTRRLRRALSANKAARATLPGLATNWRFWASMPSAVTAVLFMADPRVPGDKLLAAVDRPVFPKGVCVECGCTETDACLPSVFTGRPCHWIDKTRTRCSCCPMPKARRRR
ncbi:MAG: hypothetical protein Q8T13_05060 [Acidobacteriota bacterium]|nr:hypothetical protein [Acidobacteriota bacterium]